MTTVQITWVLGFFLALALLAWGYVWTMGKLSQRISSRSFWADAARRVFADKIATLSIGVIFLYIVLIVLVKGGAIAADWQSQIGEERALPDFSKDWHWWLGLDYLGRSIMAKVLQGAYTAMFVGLVTSLIAIPIGVTLGSLAGYFGGWVDDLITWLYTTVSNIPEILLIVAISFALGKGLYSAIFALGMTTWVSLARLIRGEFMKHKNREYVTAAEALGAGNPRRIFLHILPNVLHIIIISFSLRFVTAIKSEVVLTYLGLGAQSGTASWGLMIDDAKNEFMQGYWGNITGATVAMFIVVLAFSLLSDSLRDAFDPKLRN